METSRDTGYRDELARLTPGLRRFARALVRNHQTDVADDLVQATLTQALGGDPGRRAGRLQPWLVSILVGLHRDAMREGAADGKSGASAAGPAVAGSGARPRSGARDPALLGSIPVEYREALLLVVLEGMSYPQVAECLGLSVATVSTRVARARDYLARAQVGPLSDRPAGVAAMRGGRPAASHLRLVK